MIRALEAAGFEAGDDVEIAGTVFELDPGAPVPVELLRRGRLLDSPARLLAASASRRAAATTRRTPRTTVREFVKATNTRDAERFCDELVTQEFVEQTTGAKGDKARDACQQQLKSTQGPEARARAHREHEGRRRQGRRSRAVLAVQGQTQDQLLRLRQGGRDWKLAGGAGG